MYSKRMIKLVRCGYSRQLSSTCFLLFLSVLLWLFFCNDFLFFLLSSLSSHLSSFCFWPQNRPRRLVFSLFSLFVALVVFVFDFDDEKKETKFLIRATSSQSRRTLTRSRARLFTNTLSAYIFVVCKIRNRRSTKTHTQAKRVCLFFLFVTKE